MKLSLARLAALVVGLAFVLVVGIRYRGILDSSFVPRPVPVAPKPRGAAPAKKAPLLVATRGGAQRDLSIAPGKLLVVHFWATWCAPCREELPGLVDWWKETKADPRVELIAVSVDKDWKTADEFLRKNGAADIPLALDPASKTAAAFGTTLFPETYVLSPDGKVLHREEGPLDWRSPLVRKMLDDFRNGVPSPKAAVRNEAQTRQPA